MIKVLKFGGTSVGSAQMMRDVAEIIINQGATVVVLSAMSGITDSLIKITSAIEKRDIKVARVLISDLKKRHMTTIDELIKEQKHKDEAIAAVETTINSILDYTEQPEFLNENRVIAFGEMLSTTLFSLYLSSIGKDAKYLSSFDFMRKREDGSVDNVHLANYFSDFELQSGTIYVVQGFIATSHDGKEDNLGRGGSDYTAALIGAAISANEVQIWSDIDGIHNNDPRYVENTKGIDMMCFEEAAELAYFGAKVLHPSTIQPCREKHIPVKLKNTMEPEAFGTVISDFIDRSRTYTAVAAKDGITIIRISSTRMLMAYGFLRRVFEVFEHWKTPIDMITTSEVAVALTIDDNTNLDGIIRDLIELGSIEVESDNSIVSIVGNMDYDKAGVVRRIMDAMSEVPVKMISYGASNRSISLLVSTEHKVNSLRIINSNIF